MLALTDVAAGYVALMFCDLPPALSLIRDGKLRALGVSTKERVAALPDLAPIAEVGIPGFDAASWQMVVAPAGTPKLVVERLHGEMKDFMVQREIRDQIAAHGMLPVDTPSVANLQISVRTEIARWGKMSSRPASPDRSKTDGASYVAMTALLLCVRGVKAYYGNIAALNGVDVEVGEGEIVALIGANGAGNRP